MSIDLKFPIHPSVVLPDFKFFINVVIVKNNLYKKTMWKMVKSSLPHIAVKVNVISLRLNYMFKF